MRMIGRTAGEVEIGTEIVATAMREMIEGTDTREGKPRIGSGGMRQSRIVNLRENTAEIVKKNHLLG